MLLPIDTELRSICDQILAENQTLDEWRAIESDDAFQSTHYCGGFDVLEEAFCFSYYDDTGHEYWFQISLADIQQIVSGDMMAVLLRRAEA